MNRVAVLFVDDEEDIRYSFHDRFEDQFQVFTAANGVEALRVIQGNPQQLHVVITDIRMPEMNGLELIRRVKELGNEVGFVVVSGHADSDEIITALRVGARNFLRKPYEFGELEEIIYAEARHYQILREEKEEQERERAVDQFLRSIEGLHFELPNELEWINHLCFRIVRYMVSVGVVSDEGRVNVALGLMEIITNAIEHGNLGIGSREKMALKAQGDHHFMSEIERRVALAPYKDRKVRIWAQITPQKATVEVEDEGEGFDVSKLLDPTAPENLFSTSGRGILLARTFLDEVHYNEKGNKATLVVQRGSR